MSVKLATSMTDNVYTNTSTLPMSYILHTQRANRNKHYMRQYINVELDDFLSTCYLLASFPYFFH